MLDRDRFVRAWPALAALAFLTLFVLPARLAALRGDDSWNFEKRGQLELQGSSLGESLATGVDAAVSTARPPLLTAQGDIVAWLFDGHPMAYRLLLIFLTVVAAGLLYKLVRGLGMSRSGGALVLVVLAGAIQFRAYHDAMLGYYGTVQLVLILTLASLLWFLKGLRTGERRAYIVSLLLFLACPLLYEITYPLVALHLGIAFIERRGWAAVRAAAPFLALGLFFLLVSVAARLIADTAPAGYSVSMSPFTVLRTYFIQLFPPVPGSSLLFDAGAYGGQPTKAELLAGGWRGAAVFAGSLVLLLGPVRARQGKADRLGAIAVVGALLWLTPPLLLSVAAKYQVELGPGRGYLPVLIQVFGWALVASAAGLALVRAAARRSALARMATAIALAAFVGVTAGLVGYSNMRVIALEVPVRETRELGLDAVRAGLFDGRPERSTLLFSKRDLDWPLGKWELKLDPLEAVLLHYGDRRFDGRIVGPEPPDHCPPDGSFPPPECAPLAAARAWVHVRARHGGGSVILAPTQARLGSGRFRDAGREDASTLLVYATDDALELPRPPRLVGTTRGGKSWDSRALRWERLEQGRGWAVYRAALGATGAPSASSLDDARAQVNFSSPPPPGQQVRIYGTKGLLP